MLLSHLSISHFLIGVAFRTALLGVERILLRIKNVYQHILTVIDDLPNLLLCNSELMLFLHLTSAIFYLYRTVLAH